MQPLREIQALRQDHYFSQIAKDLQFSIYASSEAEFIKKIPASGGLLVLMNHPAEGQECLALAAALSSVRTDIKAALPSYLRTYPGLPEHCFFTDQASSLLAMNQWIKEGHVLLANSFEDISSLIPGAPKEEKWGAGVAELIEDNPTLKIVLAYLEKSVPQAGNKFLVNLSTALGGEQILSLFNGARKPTMEYLRARTYALKGRFERNVDQRQMQEIAEALDAELVQTDLNKMEVLLEERGLQVRYAQGLQIPNLLHELGRVREINFRRVGEGTGKSLDTDRFDTHYYHLVVFKPDTNTIVGGYRLSFNDQTIAQYGLEGVYNLNFFEYVDLLQTKFKNSLELGRTFVNFAGLELLPERDRRGAIYFLPLVWKGIAKILERNPRYTHLLGPVSISNQFSDLSKKIIIDFFMKKYGAEEKRWVVPRNGFTPQSSFLKEAEIIGSQLKTVLDLFQTITDIDGQALPSLLKSYEGLGARYLGFDFDKDFNTVDGMIYVDLLKADRKELTKYFGEEGLKAYLQFHGL